jgi:hypothetical protein
MSDVVKSGGISALTMESVLGTGDLAKLTVPQRVEYYTQVCHTIGVNPLTQPFRFLTFQGQIKLYATRDCTDQLRKINRIDLTIAEKRMEGDLLIVTARATTPDGRSDEDVGAVSVGRMQGEARANAIMKAVTKAKRRVTLSVCGLGFLDESEVDTIPGARTFAHTETVAPIISTEPERDVGRGDPEPEPEFVDQIEYAIEDEKDGYKRVKLIDAYAMRCETIDDLAHLKGLNVVRVTYEAAPPKVRSTIDAIWREAAKRLVPPPDETGTEDAPAFDPG